MAQSPVLARLNVCVCLQFVLHSLEHLRQYIDQGTVLLGMIDGAYTVEYSGQTYGLNQELNLPQKVYPPTL